MGTESSVIVASVLVNVVLPDPEGPEMLTICIDDKIGSFRGLILRPEWGRFRDSHRAVWVSSGGDSESLLDKAYVGAQI